MIYTVTISRLENGKGYWSFEKDLEERRFERREDAMAFFKSYDVEYEFFAANNEIGMEGKGLSATISSTDDLCGFKVIDYKDFTSDDFEELLESFESR